MLFADPGRDPDFLCVGTQRAGTTWLSVALGQHPGAWMPPFKELSYWSPESTSLPVQIERMFAEFHTQVSLRRVHLPMLRWWGTLALSEVRDRAWYRSLFAPAGARITGDVTPQYALLDDAQVSRVAAALPDAKVLLLLRHPVERAWSQLRLEQRLGRIDLSVSRSALEMGVVPRIVHGFSEQGQLYARWRKAVGDARLCVVFFDEISAAPDRAFVRVCDHLGLSLPGRSLLGVLGRRVNEAPGPDMPAWLRASLSRRYLDDTRSLAARFRHPVEAWVADMASWA